VEFQTAFRSARPYSAESCRPVRFSPPLWFDIPESRISWRWFPVTKVQSSGIIQGCGFYNPITSLI
jgi:hypothetical protein